MGNSIRKTTTAGAHTVQTVSSKKNTVGRDTSKSNAQDVQKSQSAQSQPKQKHYAVGADGKKIDVTSVFDQIEKNTQQDLKDQEKFMQDMFGDVL